MASQHDKPGDILHQDLIEYVEKRLGQETWVDGYFKDEGKWGTTVFFCALVPNNQVKEALDNPSWDLHIGDGRPGCSKSYRGDKEVVTYHRFGGGDGIEPLVLYRGFDGIKDGYWEVSEEFRLFHNLYHDRKNDRYVKIDDAGNEEEVILFENRRIRIKTKHIRQFLAIKELHLSLCFTVDRFSEKTLDELGVKREITKEARGKLAYTLAVNKWDGMSGRDSRKTHSRLFGKKLIPGLPKEKSGFWPYDDGDEKHEDFIIGMDENGEPISFTSNPDELANYFGANPQAPHYLTPVFFRREVLTKYYSKPDLYSVEDGYLRCGGLWGVQIDNDHPKHVVVFLGDLGRDVPYSEQVYWKSFNVPPEGGISKTNFRRSFLAQFADPTSADLVFKHTFDRFQAAWAPKFGWQLFKPLSEADEHNFEVLRIPVSNDQHEFDQQVLALAKVLIDSLNEEDVERQLPDRIENEKGIAKFERFLKLQGLAGYEPHTKFLKDFYGLRSSGVGHRKGKNWEKSAAKFKLGELEPSAVFEGILKQATELLEYLDERLLSVEGSQG